MSLNEFLDDTEDSNEIEEPLIITNRGLRLPDALREERHLVFRTPVATIESHLKGQNTRRSEYKSSVSAGDYDQAYLDGDGRTAEIRNPECISDDGCRIGVLVAGGEQHWFDVEIVGGESE